MTFKLRATWVVEYEADPSHYGDHHDLSATEIAEMDQGLDDVLGLFADATHVSLTVVPAPES